MNKLIIFIVALLLLENYVVEGKDTIKVKLHRRQLDKVKKRKHLMRMKRRLEHKKIHKIVKKKSFLRAMKHKHQMLSTTNVKTSLGIKSSMKMLKNRLKFTDDLSTAKINLVNFADIQFYGEIELGQKKENFKVLFDTGSSWIWLPSKTCNGCKKAGINTHYDCKESKSCVNHGTDVTIEYGMGKIRGEISTDSFFFNGKEMKDQPFLMVEEINEEMPELEFSGLVGLSPSDHMTSEYTTFLKNMKDHKLIKKQVFAVYLSRESDKKNQPEVMFGGFDITKLADKDFTYCKTSSDEYWNVQLNGLTMGSKKVGFASGHGLLDTGTSVITFPDRDFDKFLSEMKEWDSECFLKEDEMEIVCPNLKDLSKLPNLSFNLCGNEFVMGPSDYAHMVQSENDSSSMAYLKFSKLDIGNGISILGDPFLQAFYTYYDNHHKKIGIGKANHG